VAVRALAETLGAEGFYLPKSLVTRLALTVDVTATVHTLTTVCLSVGANAAAGDGGCRGIYFLFE
jgi:hypothetical protein